MTTRDVSVVVPTIGRDTLRKTVESALNQTTPPHEVIVVLDRDCELDLPDAESIIVLKTDGGVGPSHARQLGVNAASGDCIALLDDDDEWVPDKLRIQLAAAPPGESWIVSSRFETHGDAGATVFPRTLIARDQSVTEYLFSFKSLRFGGASLQTSTLLFPRSVAAAVPMSIAAGSVHDDPLWLMAVRNAFPDLQIVQCADVLVEYGLTDDSLSRSTEDRSREYLDWGLDHLGAETPRIRGDYLVTSPIAAAVAAESLSGAIRAIGAGLRRGRPGPGAWIYALLGVLRITARRTLRQVNRLRRSIAQ